MDAEKADRQEAEERAGDKLETLQERCWRGLGGFSGGQHLPNPEARNLGI